MIKIFIAEDISILEDKVNSFLSQNQNIAYQLLFNMNSNNNFEKYCIVLDYTVLPNPKEKI